MTSMGLTADDGASPAPRAGLGGDVLDLVPAATEPDGEARHRRRRALRILLAARRRDDGGRRRSES